MCNLHRKVVLFFTVVLKVFKWFLCTVKEIFRCFLSIKMYSHSWKSFYVSASQSGKFVWQNSSLAKELLDSVKKKGAIKLGDWDLKPGGFQNICQIKPRLNNITSCCSGKWAHTHLPKGAAGHVRSAISLRGGSKKGPGRRRKSSLIKPKRQIILSWYSLPY